MLLVSTPGDPLQFRPCPLGFWDRIVARIRGWSLDADLAAGAPVDSDARRAARARLLVDPKRRVALAGYWERLMATPPRPAPAQGRISLPAPCRDRIEVARPELERMVALLRSPHPVPARGVAMANLLLTDGTGPVHNRRNPADLTAEARDVVRYLDPAAELLRAADPPREQTERR
jgi:hypothetical protein